MFGASTFYYFFCRYYEAERAAFVMLSSFFIYYLIYIYVPVVGPTFYFDAVGISEILHPDNGPLTVVYGNLFAHQIRVVYSHIYIVIVNLIDGIVCLQS